MSQSSHVEVKKNGKSLQLEVDTGASVPTGAYGLLVPIISAQTKNSLLSEVPLLAPAAVLRTYNGEVLSVLGEMKVKVTYKNQSHGVMLLVVNGDRPNLFGRDWLQNFQ